MAPQAFDNLTASLRDSPYHSNLAVTQKEFFARDPSLVFYPLVYMTGREAFSLPDDDLVALRRYLDPGGGTLFADAACGSPSFDAAFRRFVAELLPDYKLEPVSKDDEIYNAGLGFDLSQCQYTKAACGIKGFPQLEGVKIDGHWAVIYSKYGIGCVLDRDHDAGCKGYTRNDAVRIGGQILILSTLP